jgi:23S rRNA pseudouridine1911/1915/1917 synthase
MSHALRITVPDSHDGARLDRALAALHPDLSRTALQALVRDGRVTVNGRVARVSQRVNAGDRLELALREPRTVALIPEPITLAIVFEDAELIVIDKPAGMVVHPGAGVPTGTLVNALLHHDPAIASVGGPTRPGIVHRLDKETSGLMVVARTQPAYLALVEALRARTVRRAYGALVWGVPHATNATIATRIGRDPRHRQRMAVVTRAGKDAVTHLVVEERLGVASRVEARLETGRTHQIRVHLAHLGHPVVGDPVYGGRVKKLLSAGPSQRSLAAALLQDLRRQALHASALELTHPRSGRELSFTSPWPRDMSQALDRLRAAARATPSDRV